MTKFNMEKNYAELAYRATLKPYVPGWLRAQEKFLKSCNKMCPRCGAILPLDSKGCDNCLFQFNNTRRKYVKRQ